jgi:hypothetical protein
MNLSVPVHPEGDKARTHAQRPRAGIQRVWKTHNEIENETHLGLRNNRSSPIGLIEPITDLELLRLFHEESDEFVIDRFLYVNARAGGTVLAGVVEDTEGGPVRGLV